MNPNQSHQIFKLVFLFLLVSVVQGRQGVWIPINLPLPAPAATTATQDTTTVSGATSPTTPSTTTPDPCAIAKGCTDAGMCTVAPGNTCVVASQVDCTPMACQSPPSGATICECLVA